MLECSTKTIERGIKELDNLQADPAEEDLESFEAFDHDFLSWADGVAIPHGIFDQKLNRGHINIGLFRDTTGFACDSFRWYWNRIGKQRFPARVKACLKFPVAIPRPDRTFSLTQS